MSAEWHGWSDTGAWVINYRGERTVAWYRPTGYAWCWIKSKFRRAAPPETKPPATEDDPT